MSDTKDYKSQLRASNVGVFHSAVTFEKIIRNGVDELFNARTGGVPVIPSSYWTYNKENTDKGKFVNPYPRDNDYVAIYSKNTWRRGMVTSRIQFTDWETYSDVTFYYGFETGSGWGTGVSMFKLIRSGGGITLEAHCKRFGVSTVLDITSELPSDYNTAKHLYSVNMGSPFHTFTIDGDPVAYVVPTEGGSRIEIGSPPYGIGTTKANVTPAGMTLMEMRTTDKEDVSVLLPPTYFRVTDNYKYPHVFRLYDKNVDTLMTTGTYDTGTSYKSHPFPYIGYQNKPFLFRADTDSVTDGLTVEVRTQEGNWRTVKSFTYSAGSVEKKVMIGQYPLARIGYEPASNGASITDAEVVMG